MSKYIPYASFTSKVPNENLYIIDIADDFTIGYTLEVHVEYALRLDDKNSHFYPLKSG